ncbi:MAG: DegQ family serine endoprotease [Proteobacteria bacterium]|nr:DegQ family serine endoprotease [Pseudomonadota bacterium]
MTYVQMLEKLRFRTAVLVMSVGLLATNFSLAEPVVSGLPDFTKLVEANRAAVVNIGTTSKRPAPSERRESPHGQPTPEGGPGDDSALQDFFRRFFGEEPPSGYSPSEPHASLGSGFIISDDGYVISNFHVVKDAQEIVVRLSDRREYIATVVGTDPRSDIAVLKVEAEKPLPVLQLGKSSTLRVGEWVLAIGSPFGFDHSVTAGIVSAKGRSLPNENYVPFIQTDVAINPGNSGGPLFNLNGEVVGVNSQIYSRTGGFMGLSFAIPIDVVMNVYTQLRENGAVTRGWLGVLIQDVTRELADSFKMKKPHGALVSKVLADSPAAEAGFKVGDVIVKFNGHEIDTSAELPPIVGTAPIGKKSPVEVVREGATKQLEVVLGILPSDDQLNLANPGQPKSKNQIERINALVRDLTTTEREQLKLSGAAGVLVEGVEPGPALDAGIQRGDIILQLNSKSVESVAGLKSLIDALKPNTNVPVLIQRQGGPLFMAMKIPAGG